MNLSTLDLFSVYKKDNLSYIDDKAIDDKALVAAVRVFEDARKFQGLLGRAVYQLVLNWEHTWDSRRSETTWMGALLRRVRVVWPRFRVQLSTPLSWTGGPMLRVETKFSLARQFHEDLRIHQWQVRQCSVLNARPRESQHDFFLFHLLSALGSGSLREKLSLEQPVTVTDTISTPIFAELPTVSTESFRILLRTLAGLEDFARTNANCFRRAAHPRLHHSTWDRSCLYCFYHHEQFYLDSEWHSFLECPLVRSPRREFVLLTKLHTFLKMIVRLKISRCLLPESGKTNIWSMLWRASRARYMILVSVGFDNSPPKPPSSGLLKCLRHVSTFSSLFILTIFQSIQRVFWVSVMLHVNPNDSSRLDCRAAVISLLTAAPLGL